MKTQELELLGQFDAEIEKPRRKLTTISPRDKRKSPSVFTFSHSDDGTTLSWTDKQGVELGGEASLTSLVCARIKEKGLIVLTFVESELAVKPIAFPERFLRTVVEWAAALQDLSCWSICPDYYDFSSPGFKMSGGEWTTCFFALKDGQLLCFNDATDKTPFSVLDVSSIASVNVLGKEDVRVLVQLTRHDGSKRLMAVETKSQAEDWKKFLSSKSSLSRSSSRSRNESFSLSELGVDLEEGFEVPDLGGNEIEWGDPDHVSEVEVRPEVRASPAFTKKASLSSGAIGRSAPRIMMGKK